MSKCSLPEFYERQWLRFSALAQFENKHPIRSRRWWERVRLGEDSVCWITSKPGHGFVMDPLDIGLRIVGQVIPEKHTFAREAVERSYGWFDNNYGEYNTRTGEGLIWGEVFLLAGRNHMTRYVGGWRAGGCDGVTIDFGSIFEERSSEEIIAGERDAARRAAVHADNMACDIAEDERIYRAQQEEEDAEV